MYKFINTIIIVLIIIARPIVYSAVLHYGYGSPFRKAGLVWYTAVERLAGLTMRNVLQYYDRPCLASLESNSLSLIYNE